MNQYDNLDNWKTSLDVDGNLILKNDKYTVLMNDGVFAVFESKKWIGDARKFSKVIEMIKEIEC